MSERAGSTVVDASGSHAISFPSPKRSPTSSNKPRQADLVDTANFEANATPQPVPTPLRLRTSEDLVRPALVAVLNDLRHRPWFTELLRRVDR